MELDSEHFCSNKYSAGKIECCSLGMHPVAEIHITYHIIAKIDKSYNGIVGQIIVDSDGDELPMLVEYADNEDS